MPATHRFTRHGLAPGRPRLGGLYHPFELAKQLHDGFSMLAAQHTTSTRRGESAMQYTLVLTEKTEDDTQGTIPALPACTIEAATRDEAIRLAHEAIAQLVSRSEIVQIDIPQQHRATAQTHGVPWE